MAKHPGESKLEEFMEYAQAFRVYQEREREIDMLTFAVLCKEHVLFQGVAGTAKSELSRQFFRGITDARTFEQQFTAFMDESYVFGPQIIDDLVKRGNVIHNTKDSLADTEFALLDEFFNANEELVVSCNEVFNERTFTRNQQKEKCPLITAVMTTNQDRTGEEKLKPIYDRIMFTSIVPKVSDPENRAKMLRSSVEKSLEVKAQFDYANFADIYDYIDQCEVAISDSFVLALDKMCMEFQKQSKKYISDRKEAKTLKFLRLVAILDGSMELDEDHLLFARFAWVALNNTAEETSFDAALASAKAWLATENVAKKAVSKAKKELDAISAPFQKRKVITEAEYQTAVASLGDMKAELITALGKAKASSNMSEAILKEMEAFAEELATKVKAKASSRKVKDAEKAANEILGSTTEELMSDENWLGILKDESNKKAGKR